MKKHYIIIGIVLVSALFFIPEIIKKLSGGTTVSRTEETPTETNLNERIEKLGQNPWSRTDYDVLATEITGYFSDQQINSSQRDDYYFNLNINMQKALALSFKNALSNCFSSSITEIKKASDTIKQPIQELLNQKRIYQNYKRALDYKNNLNTFLAGKYSDQGASSLKNAYQQACDGQSFQNCAKIQNLKNEIAQKLAKFQSFHTDYYIKMPEKDPDIDYYLDNPSPMSELKSHSYYYKDFLSRQ
jgi:hypothetical protein